MSDRAAASIVSATLESAIIVNSENTDNIVDRIKYEENDRDWETNWVITFRLASLLYSIYFDGLRHQTLTKHEIDGVIHPRMKEEDHVVILEELYSKYIGHVSVENGTAWCITSAFLNFFENHKICLENLKGRGVWCPKCKCRK